MQKVVIASPSYAGQFCAEYVMSLSATYAVLVNAGIPCVIMVKPGLPFVDMARNDLVDEFLKSDATDLLFIDDDIGWDSRALTRFLSHDKDVCVGLVPKRHQENENDFHSNALTGKKDGCLMQCLEAPTAFMRIRRQAFEKLRAAAHPQTDGKQFRYFHAGTAAADWGEDIYFCRKWAALGEFIWIDADISFSHWGRKGWRGNFYEHLIETSGLIQSPQPVPAEQSSAA